MEHQTIYSKLRVWDKGILLCHSKINVDSIELSNVRWSFFHMACQLFLAFQSEEKNNHDNSNLFRWKKSLLEFFSKVFIKWNKAWGWSLFQK